LLHDGHRHLNACLATRVIIATRVSASANLALECPCEILDLQVNVLQSAYNNSGLHPLRGCLLRQPRILRFSKRRGKRAQACIPRGRAASTSTYSRRQSRSRILTHFNNQGYERAKCEQDRGLLGRGRRLGEFKSQHILWNLHLCGWLKLQDIAWSDMAPFISEEKGHIPRRGGGAEYRYRDTKHFYHASRLCPAV
jgi:hypothetical protein